MLHKPLLGENYACRTSTRFHEPLLNGNCTYRNTNLFHELLAFTAFVQPVTAFTGLCGMLSAFAKPLPDFTSL